MCCLGLFYHFTQIPWRAQNASKIYSHLRATTGTLACSNATEGSSLCQGWCDFWTAESIQWVTECWWKTKERHKMYKHIFIWKILRKRGKKTPTDGYRNPLLFDPEGAEVLILASAAFRICICTEVSFTRRGKQCGGGSVAVRAQGWSSGEHAVLQTRWRLAVHEGQHNGERGTTKRGVYLNR